MPITDEEAVCAFEYLSRTEGIIPAIESAHAVAAAMKIAPSMNKDQVMVIKFIRTRRQRRLSGCKIQRGEIK